ncbi:MAG: hypothetical protein JW958_13600 [Candidatus Eisenbacteria bacterium]|nr:hypothetical protein [Candidatus Eisenbacteria bacterium]
MNGRTIRIGAALVLLAGLAFLVGCGGGAKEDKGQILQGVGFSTPESILHDEQGDFYLIANINGDPSAEDGNGFITRFGPATMQMEIRWIDGAREGIVLDAPKGMAIHGDRLYVADIHTLRVFNRNTGFPVEDIPIEGSLFLNDVAAAPNGVVYVTDTEANVIWRVSTEGVVDTFAAGEALGHPNGITVSEGVVFAVGGNRLYEVRHDGTIHDVATLPAGGLDGLVPLPIRGFLVSSWEGSAVYMVQPDGGIGVIAGELPAPADIGWDNKRLRLLIPFFRSDRVEARPVGRRVES